MWPNPVYLLLEKEPGPQWRGREELRLDGVVRALYASRPPGSKEIVMNKLAILEQKTDIEIALAIHYLDPEFAAKRSAEDTGTILGISVAFLALLAGALTYICFYVRTL